MTEAEAKTKWCPFSRCLTGDDTGGAVTVNRPFLPEIFGDGSKLVGNNCIGSRCMAWRWHLDSGGWEREPPDGYCGLAGAVA